MKFGNVRSGKLESQKMQKSAKLENFRPKHEPYLQLMVQTMGHR